MGDNRLQEMLEAILGSETRVTRLVDMDTREVSLVDRPANKRAFLLVKNEGDEVAKGETPMKTEAGVKFPASAYAYTPDTQKPSTWKLRLYDKPGDETPSARFTAAAAMALTQSGFRGNQVQLSEVDKAAVEAKVRAGWLKARPQASEKDLPAALKKAEAAQTLAEVLLQAFEDGVKLDKTDTHIQRVEKTAGSCFDLYVAIQTNEPETVVKQKVAALVADQAVLARSFAPVPTKKETKMDPKASESPVEKLGRPMNGDRLNRFKGAITLLKEALVDLRSGSVSLEKFQKVAGIFGSIISELDVAKYAVANVGGATQPDTNTVAGFSAVFGPGVPVPLEIQKGFDGLKGQNAALASENKKLAESIAKRDLDFAAMRKDLDEIRKTRTAPAARPFDEEGSSRRGQHSDDEVALWAPDMAELSRD